MKILSRMVEVWFVLFPLTWCVTIVWAGFMPIHPQNLHEGDSLWFAAFMRYFIVLVGLLATVWRSAVEVDRRFHGVRQLLWYAGLILATPLAVPVCYYRWLKTPIRAAADYRLSDGDLSRKDLLWLVTIGTLSALLTATFAPGLLAAAVMLVAVGAISFSLVACRSAAPWAVLIAQALVVNLLLGIAGIGGYGLRSLLTGPDLAESVVPVVNGLAAVGMVTAMGTFESICVVALWRWLAWRGARQVA